MDEILNGKSIKADFEAQVTAALMIQSNVLITIKLQQGYLVYHGKRSVAEFLKGHFQNQESCPAGKIQYAKRSICRTFMSGLKTLTFIGKNPSH